MSIVDKLAPLEWSFPYKLEPYFFNKRLARSLLNKHAYVGLGYVGKNGKIYKRELFHGTIIGVDPKDGVQIWQHDTGKVKTLPPDLRSWKRALKQPYKDRKTGEVITNVDYTSTWLVLRGHLLSPQIGSEKLAPGKSGTYNVYGFGTRMVGKANKGNDRSFTTTKWFTLLYFPIWPLGTYRISGRKQTITFGFGLNGEHTSYPLFLDTRQVARTYLLWIPLLTIFIFAVTR